MLFSTQAIKYFSGLRKPDLKFSGIEIINPYERDDVKEIVKKFYSKFYNDSNKRIFVIGINPGRFGGGLTGIAFTAPVTLRELCGIENNFGSRKELSSKFIYTVVDQLGGVKKFFSRVFLTALYPFAIIKDGKNYNYYDDKSLANTLKDGIVKTIKSQIEFGANRNFAVLLGKKNADYFFHINEKQKFFEKIFILEHPRYIMQYKLKQIDQYINKYIDTINFQQ
ncbi:MAG: uracil-DNA glycosylase family protein [Ignavibacteriaceae bacterium]